MGDIEGGKCEVCGVEGQLTRTYFHYDIKCECHSPNHFELIRHCATCIPSELKRKDEEPIDKKKEQIIVPKTLDEAFEILKNEQVGDFKNELEDDLALYHNTIGGFLRNEWGLWTDTNELCYFFKSIGIQHADDRSSIILTSFHRYLNNKPIDLKEQVLRYWKHWTEYKQKGCLPPEITGVSDEYLKHYELNKTYFND